MLEFSQQRKNKIEGTKFANSDLFYFQKTRAFIEEDNPSEKVVKVKERLDGIDEDDIRNLEDSPRLVFINEECENLIVVNDDGELTRNIKQKKKLSVLQ